MYDKVAVKIAILRILVNGGYKGEDVIAVLKELIEELS